MEAKEIKLCDQCQLLLGAGRHVQPHSNLIFEGKREVPSQFGNVDEYYYRCSKCEKKWLRETGNYGHGWVE